MASLVYSTYVKAIVDGDVDFLADTIKACLVKSASYTVNGTTHDFFDDVTAGARATNGIGTLASKTSSIATNVITVDAADLTLTSVSGSGTFDAVVIYKDTGVESTSQVIAYLELTSGITLNGGNVVLQWNASGLFTLTR